LSLKIGLIGGTGLYGLEFLEKVEKIMVSTIYGQARISKATVDGIEVFFLPRHGSKHSVPPHLVNYRANVAALKFLGVKKVFATAASGSLNRKMPPGSIVIIDQFIDLTSGRPSTFYDGTNYPVAHTDFTEPYCPGLREVIMDECRKAGHDYFDRGTYIATEGPRFETPAEIRAYRHMGGDLVGMTNVPEVVLAREAGLCYAAVALVTNYAAGISPDILSHEEVLEVMALHGERISKLFLSSILNTPEHGKCSCFSAGEHFEINGSVHNVYDEK
jgi:5'-methylthioadenosine phosphorylase